MSATLFFVGIAVFVALIVALPFAIISQLNRQERAARDHLRASGARCVAYVRTFRRISMTQHRVLFEIHLPAGPVGREYVLTELTDAWLADACALGRPVAVIAHPDAATIVFADAP